MKKNFLLYALLLCAICTSAQHVPQSYNDYVPFHQYLQQHHADIQQHGNSSRAIVYREIGYTHLQTLDNGSNWSYADSGSYFYNGNAFQTGGNTSTFVSNNWVNNTQFTDNTGGYGPLFSELGQVWNAGTSTYDNSYLDSFTYVNGYFTQTTVHQTWSGGAWVNVFQLTNAWNGSNNLTSSLHQVWSSGSWQYDTAYVYNYNVHNLNTVTIKMAWSGSAWDSVLKQTYSYDANYNNFQVFGFSRNGANWDNYSLTTKSFNAATNQITGSLTQLWDGSTYVNSYQDRYIYDFNDNNTQYANFTWNSANTGWDAVSLQTYNYDANANRVYELDANYTNGAYKTTDSYFYNYQPFALLGINETKNELAATIYPNPATGNQLTLNLSVADNSVLTTNMYDAAGRIIKTTTNPVTNGNNTLNISISGISAGNYYLQITDKTTGKSSVLKFVKE